jgi:hypothetical protein
VPSVVERLILQHALTKARRESASTVTPRRVENRSRTEKPGSAAPTPEKVVAGQDGRSLVVAEILHVHVGAEPGVVGEVPAVVVWIVVDRDWIGIPQPVAAEAEIVRCDAEVVSAKPEPSRATACEVKDMAAPEPAGESTVLEGMIEVIVRVVTTAVMTNPAAVGVHMRCVRMSLAVTEGRVVAPGFPPSVRRTWAVGRSESAATHVTAATAARMTATTAARMTATTAPLRERRDGTEQHHHDQTHVLLHEDLQKGSRFSVSLVDTERVEGQSGGQRW